MTEPVRPKILRRAVTCAVICVATVAAFYLSLIFSSRPLSGEESLKVDEAIDILANEGFKDEVYYLRNFTFFRGNDNWLNALVAKESAYAATNYPFGIMTVYQEFFVYTRDDVERAAVLLHEARHLMGEDEKQAYEYVWKNKFKIGWTQRNYGSSAVWLNVRKQTREIAPGLFVCEFNDFGDCFE